MRLLPAAIAITLLVGTTACDGDDAPDRPTTFSGVVLWADDRSPVVGGEIEFVGLRRTGIGTPHSSAVWTPIVPLDEFSAFDLAVDANSEIDYFHPEPRDLPRSHSSRVPFPDEMSCPRCDEIAPGRDHEFELLVERP